MEEEWEVPAEWALWEVSQAQCKCQEELVVQVVQEQVELELEQQVVWEEQVELEQQVVWEEQEVWEACHQEWA